MNHWTRALYQPGLPLGSDGRRVTSSQKHKDLARVAAAEGAVLLKNNNHVLPLKKGSKVALFGKGISDYVKGGGGSSDVTVEKTYTILDGFLEKEAEKKILIDHEVASYYQDYVLNKYAGGALPGLIAEPDFPEQLALSAKESCDIAVIAISRFSGEGWDRKGENDSVQLEEWVGPVVEQSNRLFENGDFYLSCKEKNMVDKVCSIFDNIIVILNVGGVVDTLWFSDNPKIKGALLALQGGMMGGLAVADLLVGDVNPSGKLVDTYAKSLSDYPSTQTFHASLDAVEYQEDIYVGYRYFNTIPDAFSKVVYPFGYGLSYTEFSIKETRSYLKDDKICICCEVCNEGDVAGKEVVEVYVKQPSALLDTPALVLVGFKKTKLLLPKEKEEVEVVFSLSQIASFDEKGVISEAAWVLQKGRYEVFFGDSIVNIQEISLDVEVPENRVIEKVSHRLVPHKLTRRLHADGKYEEMTTSEYAFDECAIERQDINCLEGVVPVARQQNRMTREELSIAKSDGLEAVAEGRKTLDALVVQMDDDTLCDIVGGQPNTGVANCYGYGNQPQYGIPNIMTADGPAGVRIKPECEVFATGFPCATLLASTWDVSIVESIGAAGGAELKENNMFVWLTPAVNIHRSPLCGRNFEYYSEDPFLTGKLASAMVRGIQSNHVSACVKHFAFNNKETNRKESDSIVSERAAREIYLKQFEIIVKESSPYWIMSSYNKVNGIRAAENKELLTDILRNEWGYQGAVMTDWWNHAEEYLELKAGNDLKMGTGYRNRVSDALKKGLISRKELEVNVKRILDSMLRMDY